MRAYEHLSDFRGEASFSTWLTRIAIHEALARKRREQRFTPLDPTSQESMVMPVETTRSPEQQANDHQLRAVLERASYRTSLGRWVSEPHSGEAKGAFVGPKMGAAAALRAREWLSRSKIAAEAHGWRGATKAHTAGM